MNVDMSPQIWVVIAPLVMGLVWLIRLEGRVNTSALLLEAVRADLAYIRGRIDDAVKRDWPHS